MTEQILYRESPSVFFTHPLAFVASSGLVMWGFAFLVMESAIALPLLMISFAMFFHLAAEGTLIVTTECVKLEYGGRILEGEDVQSIPIRACRNVYIHQNFLQRIFDVGDIKIAASGTDQYEISISNIPKPYDVQQLIDDLQNNVDRAVTR